MIFSRVAIMKLSLLRRLLIQRSVGCLSMHKTVCLHLPSQRRLCLRFNVKRTFCKYLATVFKVKVV